MEQKTSVVKKAFNPPDPKTKVPSTTSLSVEFENGDKGYFKLLKGVEHPFVAGAQVTYEIAKVEGRNYSVVTLPTATPKPQESPKEESKRVIVPPELAKDLAQMKYNVLIPVAQIVMEAVKAGKIEADLVTFREWYNGIMDDIYSSIDDLKW